MAPRKTKTTTTIKNINNTNENNLGEENKNCNICEDICDNNYNWIKCNKCMNFFHLGCHQININLYKKIKNQNSWLCFKCLNNSNKIISIENENINNQNISSNDIRQIINSVEFMSSKYDIIMKQMKILTNEIKDLKNELNYTNKTNDSLNNKLKMVNINLNSSKNENISNNLVISNLPNIENKTIEETIIKLAEEIKMPLNKKDILSCQRLKLNKINDTNNSYKINYVPPIIISFNDINKRNEFLAAKKKINLTQNLLNVGPAHEKIYINYQLSKEKHELLIQSKKLKKYGIKFIWCSKEQILYRRNDNSKILKINNLDHLSKIESEFILEEENV